MDKKQLAWIEIDRRALTGNVKNLQKIGGPKLKLAVAAKANAYGHGLPQVVTILDNAAVPYLALHSTREAEIARAAGWKRNIMLVGPVAPTDIDSIIRLDLEPSVFEISFLKQLGQFCRKSEISVPVHLKLETGTHRQGLLDGELKKIARVFKDYPQLKAAGISTHFANIEDTTDHSYAMTQLGEFKHLTANLNKLGVKPKLKHTACSAALLLFKDTYFDMARPGIAVYGYWPSRETYVSYRLGGGKNNILKPALSFKARITQLKTVPADSFIGYGCTYRASTRLRIAVLPVGYSDGIDRRLSNLGYVLVHGRRAPIRGRVCMNLIMVDVTDIPGVKLYDTATIIGRDGKEKISADTHAAWCQTISYEIISRLSPDLPRFVI